MAKVRVPLYGAGQQRVATVDTEATRGAIVGVNLLNPDGSLFVPAAGAPVPPGSGIALDDVQALAAHPLTVDGSPAAGAFAYGWNGTTDDVPEGATNLYYTDARVDARVAATVTQHTDGGGASAVYTAAQHIDGGGASAVYTAAQHIDGGGASG